MLKRRIKFTRLVLVFFLILAWTFIGWARILNFPSGIQEAQAITVVTPSTNACGYNQLTISSHNISGSNSLLPVVVSLDDGAGDNTIGTVSYNSINITQLAGIGSGGSNSSADDNNYAEIWYLDPSLNPDERNYDIVTVRGRGGSDDDSDSRGRGGSDDDSGSRGRGGSDDDSDSRGRGGSDDDSGSDDSDDDSSDDGAGDYTSFTPPPPPPPRFQGSIIQKPRAIR